MGAFPGRPLLGTMTDLRRARLNPTTRELVAHLEFLASLEDRFENRWALVAEPDSLLFGLARMASVHAGELGLNMEAFTSVEEASDWLHQIET